MYVPPNTMAEIDDKEKYQLQPEKKHSIQT